MKTQLLLALFFTLAIAAVAGKPVQASAEPVIIETDAKVKIPTPEHPSDEASLYKKGVQLALHQALVTSLKKITRKELSPVLLRSIAEIKNPQKKGFIHLYRITSRGYDPLSQAYSLNLKVQLFQSKLIELLDMAGISAATVNQTRNIASQRIHIKVQFHFLHLPEQSRLIASLMTEELDRSGLVYFFDNLSETGEQKEKKDPLLKTETATETESNLPAEAADTTGGSDESREDLLLKLKEENINRKTFNQTIEANYLLNLKEEGSVLQFFLSEKIFNINGSLIKAETFSGEASVIPGDKDSLLNASIDLTKEAVAKILESLPRQKEELPQPGLPPS